jgi:hypothetical protein
MIWAGVSWYGKTVLVFLKGRLNATAYTNTLRSALLPFLENIAPRKPIFQHDNASIHAAATPKRSSTRRGWRHSIGRLKAQTST